MSQVVTNPSADKEEKIEHAAKLLRSSRQVKEVFIAIYSGRRPFKIMEEIRSKVSKFNKNTQKAAAKLYGEDLVSREKTKGGYYKYGKLGFYKSNFKAIVRLSENPKRLKNYPTKRKINAQIRGGKFFNFLSRPQAIRIYLDDIDSFKKVRKIKNKKIVYLGIHSVSERKINRGICRILDNGEKNDWGGERNDIFASIILERKRKAAAFALKGKGKQGILTLNKMGHKGDQVQRLFESSAEVHFLVYHDTIDERVHDQMQIMAIHKSVTNNNKRIYFCLIDGKDLARLMIAYPNEFAN